MTIKTQVEAHWEIDDTFQDTSIRTGIKTFYFKHFEGFYEVSHLRDASIRFKRHFH